MVMTIVKTTERRVEGWLRPFERGPRCSIGSRGPTPEPEAWTARVTARNPDRLRGQTPDNES